MLSTLRRWVQEMQHPVPLGKAPESAKCIGGAIRAEPPLASTSTQPGADPVRRNVDMVKTAQPLERDGEIL